jgi:penicillin-binding protein 1A
MPTVTTGQAESPGHEGPPRGRGVARRVLVWLRRLAIVATVLAGLGAAAVALALEHYGRDLPSTKDLKSYHPAQVTRVLARDGTVLGEVYTERRTLVPIDAIPKEMKLAALAAEDATFYEHKGLDYFGMARAVLVNLRGGRRQGASTITQQVIKNVLLTPERTIARKAKELILARRIEQELTKDEILELYLNQIYFGHGRWGVEEAARYYFGKSVREVSLGEAALLAAVVKGPGVYSPRVDMARATERRAFVLDQMAAKGFAPAELVEAAKRAPIRLASESEVESELAPEVVAEALRTLRSVVGAEAERGGYTVTTTVDPALETAARAAVRKDLDDYAKRHKLLAPLAKARHEPAPFDGPLKGRRALLGVVTGADDAKGTLRVRVGQALGTVSLKEAARYNPKGLPPSQFADVGKVVRVSVPGDEVHADAPRLRLELGPEAALVAIDVRTRQILALVGSYEGVPGGLDRASSSRRQPGSTFKAFVYAYAIHARTMTPASILETSPAALSGYRPDNYDESEGRAPKRLREALAHSVNVAAAWTLEKVGPSNVVAYAHALGIESKLGADLSLALGAYEVTPREMAAAYATLAAGGVYDAPVLVTKIVGPNGAEVALPPRPPARRVMDEAEAFVVTDLLTSVVKTGTGVKARSLGRPIAGKTGTSNQSKDAWFVGYSTDIACAVWTGYDDPAPLGAGEVGATAALPAFVDFMREAHKGRPVADFAVPPGVVRVKIDPESGLRAPPDDDAAIDEVFLAGTEPTEVATPDAGAADADAGAPDAGLAAASDAGTAPKPPADAGDMGAAPAAPTERPAPAPPPF